MHSKFDGYLQDICKTVLCKIFYTISTNFLDVNHNKIGQNSYGCPPNFFAHIEQISVNCLISIQHEIIGIEVYQFVRIWLIFEAKLGKNLLQK